MPPSHIFTISQPQQHFQRPPHDNYHRAQGDYGSVGRRHQSYHRNSLGRQPLNPHCFANSSTNNPRRVNSSYPNAALSPFRLSRKPRTWRKGYNSPSKGGLGSYWSRISSFLARNPTFDRHLVHLNPFIYYRPHRTGKRVIFDMRIKPLPHLGVRFLNRPANTLDYYQLATSPPMRRLTIWHPNLPWHIKVQASNPNGVTVQDLLFGIYTQLWRPISQAEYYTEELTSRDREMLTLAFAERCGGDLAKIAGGVRRIDFLGREVGFVGLTRSRNGIWEMKTVVPEWQRMMID